MSHPHRKMSSQPINSTPNTPQGLPGLRIGWLVTTHAPTLARAKELRDYTTICPAAPSECLASIALRSRSLLLARARALVSANAALADAFFEQHASYFEAREREGGREGWERRAGWERCGSGVRWPGVGGRVGAMWGRNGARRPPHSPSHTPPLSKWHSPAAGPVAFPRLVSGEAVDAFCARAASDAGVLLLPATVYDDPRSVADGRFRVGLGLAGLGEALEALGTCVRGSPMRA